MDRPKITDKVRFWEEQDKINQALIPRVLEMHEHIKKANLLAQKNSSQYLNLSSEIKDLKLEINKFIKGTSNNLKELDNKIQSIKSEQNGSLKLVKDETNNISERVRLNESDLLKLKEKLDKFSGIVSVKPSVFNLLALAISIIALIVAIVNS